MTDNRIITLDNGNYIYIKFDIDGIVYDMYDKNNNHIESIGFDLYEEIRNLIEHN
jgi:hypothetical protein